MHHSLPRRLKPSRTLSRTARACWVAHMRAWGVVDVRWQLSKTAHNSPRDASTHGPSAGTNAGTAKSPHALIRGVRVCEIIGRGDDKSERRPMYTVARVERAWQPDRWHGDGRVCVQSRVQLLQGKRPSVPIVTVLCGPWRSCSRQRRRRALKRRQRPRPRSAVSHR